MVGSNSRSRVAVTVMLGSLLLSSTAYASSFGLREYSTISMGMASAGNATGGGGISGMFFNPATITMAPGFQAQQSFNLIVPQAKVRSINTGTTPPFNGIAALGESGDIGQGALVPSGALSYQVNENLFLGIVSGAPYGLVTKPNQTWAGQSYARSSRIFSINVTPTVGYKINDFISVGAGVQFQYFKTVLKNALSSAGGGFGSFLPGAPSAKLEGDNLGVGFTAGVTITPIKGTSIGVGFRSMIEHKLDGTFDAPSFGFNGRPISSTIRLPEVVTLGIRQDINDKLTVSAGAEWTNWSRFSTFPVQDKSTGAQLQLNPLSAATRVALPFQYKNSWYFSLGAEYKIDPSWTVRTGLGYDFSPIKDDTRGLRLPDNNRFWVSLGASYNWNEQISFDVGYSHLFIDKTKISIVPGNPNFSTLPFNATAEANVNVFSVGFRYKFGEVLKKEAAIVKKY